MSEVTDVASTLNMRSPRCFALFDSVIYADWKEDVSFLFALPGKRCLYFIVYPFTFHRGLREDKQKPILEPDLLINTRPDPVPDLHVFRRKPAANILALQIGIESFSNLLVVTGVTDETTVVLNRSADERMHVFNEGIVDASASKKCFRDVATRAVDGVNSYA